MLLQSLIEFFRIEAVGIVPMISNLLDACGKCRGGDSLTAAS